MNKCCKVTTSSEPKYGFGALAMLIEKLVRMASQLIILIIMSRQLGVTELGNLLYCFALASIFMFLNNLGLDSIVTKIFVERANKQLSYLKHALFMRLSSAVLCIVLINICGLWLVSPDSRLLLFIISLYQIFLPFNVYDWFYQSRGRGDLSAICFIAGHISGFIFRVSVLYIFDGELLYLGAAYVIETMVMALCFMFVSKKNNLLLQGPISFERSSKLLREASPLIISGAIVMLYMKVDQLMLGYMINDAEVGHYAVATRLSEAWYFVGLTFISVYFPKILNMKKQLGLSAYYSEIIKLGRILIWASICLAITTIFISDWLITFLYGEEFIQSSDVLIVTIWAVPFVYLGAISTRMYVVTSSQKVVLMRSVCGLILNVFLNLLLIKDYGALGAGVASLVAQIGACYLFNALTFKKHEVFKVQSNILLFFMKNKYIVK